MNNLLLDPQFIKIVSKYSNKILELVDSHESLTQSDLQGVCEAIIMGAIQEGREI